MITGGGGMLGRNLLAHPGLNDFEVLAPSRKDLDLTDYSAVQDWMLKWRPDSIIHCAGRVGSIQQNSQDPARFLIDNLRIGINVVDSAVATNVNQLINIGSTNAYPAESRNPLREEHAFSGFFDPPTEGYGIAKAVTTRLCSYLDRSPTRSFKTVVPCNLFGEYDSFEPERSHLVPSVIRKVVEAKKTAQQTVEIWGDGTARRQLLLASDLADFLVFALRQIDSLPDVMNIAPPEDVEILHVYRMVAEIVGWNGVFTHDLSKPAGTQRRIVDVSRMMMCGWSPPTPIRSGLERTCAYYLESTKP